MKTRFDWALSAHNVIGLSSSLGMPIWRGKHFAVVFGIALLLGGSFLCCWSRSHCEGFLMRYTC